MNPGNELVELAVKIELECAALYEVYARCFARDAELVYFWRIYAEAERYHAATIRIHQFGLVEPAVQDSPPDPTAARTFLAELQSTREAAERRPPTVSEALERARWVEESSAELHGRTQFFQGHPQLAELFRAMAEEDRSHREMLGNAERRWAGG
jgi:hypothetical protein